jgi:mono/diheme cytochrome c family protein
MRYAIPLTAALFLSAAGVSFAADGPTLYKQNCASCHGATGQADTPASKALNVPPLAGDPKVAGLSEADVGAKIRSNPKHAAVLKKLSDADVQALAVFVKELAASK